MASQKGGFSGSLFKKGGGKVSSKLLDLIKKSGEIPSSNTPEEDFAGQEAKKDVSELESRSNEVLYHFKQVQGQEKEIYNREQKETEKEINILRQEVIELAKTARNLDGKLQIAAEQPIVNPGASDVSFLTNLRKTIRYFRRKLEDASIWLEMWNQKHRQKGAFWNRFLSKKGGGAGYMFSSEHYSARSAG